MKFLEGKKIADKITLDIKKKISASKTKPGLAVILIGRNKASEIYVKLKKKRAEETGINFYLFRFNNNSREKNILEKIKILNKDRKISGIIVQLPLPGKFKTQKIINAINPQKDVDGFSSKEKRLKPVFPMAIIELAKSSGKKLKGREALVVANSHIFGKEMLVALEREKIKARYIISGKIAKKLGKIKSADLLITATGKPGIIKGNMLKNGAVVIDGGIFKKGKKVFGDVDLESTKNISGYLSPVPGGVGPVTIACLLRNVYLASKF